MIFFEMLAQVRKWWTTWHTVPVLSWIRAAALFRSGQFALAERAYRQGLTRYPNHPANFCARLDLGYCLFKLGKISQAEEELKYVTVHLPEMKEGHLRLARVQLWRGHSLNAAWTIRRALRILKPDADLAATFLFAVLDNGGPWYLLEEAEEACHRVLKSGVTSVKIDAGLAFLELERGGNNEERRNQLAAISMSDKAPADSLILMAQAYLSEGKVAHARRQLRRALTQIPDSPKILSLLARSYLVSGPFYNAESAKQLALTACQKSEWSSPREMHVLAEAYYHTGDKISALVIASKAKEEGGRILGSYRESKSLDQLIESLSIRTVA